jgi:hypothetical protein
MSLWAPHQLEVLVCGPEGESRALIDKPYGLIGRHPKADVVLSSSDVPRRAVYVQATTSGLLGRRFDRSSPDKAEVAAADGALCFDFGETKIAVRLVTSQASSELPALSDQHPPVLRVVQPKRGESRRRLFHALEVVGRDPACGIELRERHVSAFHCMLYWKDRRLWCIDLRSGNGVLLEGEPIECAEVLPGQTLEVGRCRVTFERWSRSQVPDSAGSHISAPAATAVESITTLVPGQDEAAARAAKATQSARRAKRRLRRLTRQMRQEREEFIRQVESLQAQVRELVTRMQATGSSDHALPEVATELPTSLAEIRETGTSKPTPDIPLDAEWATQVDAARGKGVSVLPRRRRPVEPADEPLRHLVSDRLKLLDRPRRLRNLLLWSASLGTAALFAVLLLWNWLSS